MYLVEVQGKPLERDGAPATFVSEQEAEAFADAHFASHVDASPLRSKRGPFFRSAYKVLVVA